LPTARPARRSSRLPLTGGLVLAAFAFFAAGWLLRPLFQSKPTRSFGRVVRLTHGPARSFAPAISPDGKWIAYLSDARGPTDVWVQFLAGGEAANLTEKTGLTVGARTDIGGLDISPDGRAACPSTPQALPAEAPKSADAPRPEAAAAWPVRQEA